MKYKFKLKYKFKTRNARRDPHVGDIWYSSLEPDVCGFSMSIVEEVKLDFVQTHNYVGSTQSNLLKYTHGSPGYENKLQQSLRLFAYLRYGRYNRDPNSDFYPKNPKIDHDDRIEYIETIKLNENKLVKYVDFWSIWSRLRWEKRDNRTMYEYFSALIGKPNGSVILKYRNYYWDNPEEKWTLYLDKNGPSFQVYAELTPSEAHKAFITFQKRIQTFEGNMVDINTIHNESCLVTMEKMGDDFIDLVVCSPPYDQLRLYNGYSFPFEDIAKSLYRVVKPGGVIVWVVNDSSINGSESGTSFRQALYFKEVGFNLHDTMIYQKNNPTPISMFLHKRYEQNFEYMFILSKGIPKTFNPIMIEKIGDERRGTKQYNREKDGSFKPANNIKDTLLKIKGNIWSYSVGLNLSTQDKVAFEHPAIYPEKLVEDHIYSWSNKGDLVYDPFTGSGTTLKMAMQMRRNWIGSEISSEYVSIAYRRIEPYRWVEDELPLGEES